MQLTPAKLSLWYTCVGFSEVTLCQKEGKKQHREPPAEPPRSDQRQGDAPTLWDQLCCQLASKWLSAVVYNNYVYV